jgi:hypothetical protein
VTSRGAGEERSAAGRAETHRPAGLQSRLVFPTIRKGSLLQPVLRGHPRAGGAKPTVIPRESGLGPTLGIQRYRDDRHFQRVGPGNSIRAAPVILQTSLQSPALSLPATHST